MYTVHTYFVEASCYLLLDRESSHSRGATMSYRRGHGGDERRGQGGGRGFGALPQHHGGGRGFGALPQRADEVQVITNRWRLTPIPPSSPHDNESSDYIQYRVTIKNGWYKRIVSNEGTTTAGGEEVQRVFESKEISIKDMDRMATASATASAMPWRIMKKLDLDEPNIEVAYDGNQKAYSPSGWVPVDGQEYRVKVKRDCENDDPDSDRVKDRWYVVVFHKTNTIRYSDVMKQLSGEISTEEITMLFNVVLKSTAILYLGMISLDPRSSAVYFPLQDQHSLLQKHYVEKETKDKTKIFLSGLQMNVVTQGGMFAQIENSTTYADKEYWQILQEDDRHRDGASRVPLLNQNNATICGIPIANLHRPITNHLLESIEEAIGKLGSVHVIYTSKKNVKPGKDGVLIYKNKPFRKSKREDDSKGHGKRIISAANDRLLYSFSVEGEELTVASYFDRKFGIKLKYPNLPIIYVDSISKHGGGWYPIEFVYQAFNKSKDNSNEIIQNTLKYCDKIAGREYINEVQMKLDMLQFFSDRLMRWGVTINESPEVETARVLMPPKISFNSKTVPVNNGSFNMKDVRFSRPATLTSFAVVNFTSDKKSCYDFIKTELRILRKHGIEIQSETMMISENDYLLDLVSEQGRDSVDDALQVAARAVEKAKNIHLHDSQQLYRKNNVFFRTNCCNEEPKHRECLVLPPIENDGPLGLLLNYEYNNGSKQDEFFSHRVTAHDGREHCVRLMVKIKETDTLIDPFDFRYQNGRHQAYRSKGEWQNVNFVEHCYVSQNDSTYYKRDIHSERFYHLVEDYEVDFPSMVFVYLPDKEKAIYDRIKVITNLLGIQTQCAVMKQFKGQRNKEQYASNIATKINAKLSTAHDKAISWTSSFVDRSNADQLPWVGERPTLIVGVGIVHGMFKSVVAASVCLDKGCMRLSHSCFIQKKSDCISDSIMTDIMKVAIDDYEIDNKCFPERVLFFRDGISDGNFRQAGIEIEAIRKALADRLPGRSIPITFVVCQSQQQGFKMVPNESIPDYRGNPMTNVRSGTSLQCGDSSFYLIAQGGLKGTSKPVKHIVIINENESPVDGIGLTLLNLENLANQMCYKYPTATKAVREVPAIKYAKKLANQVFSSIRFLENGCKWFERKVRLICPEGDTLTEDELRPYLKLTRIDGTEGISYNILQTPFRNHLAA